MAFPVQQFSAADSVSSSTLSVTVPTGGVAAGRHLLIAIVNSGSTSLSGVADSRGNTYQIDSGRGGAGYKPSIVSARLTTALLAGDTITATFSASIPHRSMLVCEADDLVETGWMELQVGPATGTNTAPDSGSPGTTTQADERIFGVASTFASTALVWTAGDFGVGSGSATLLNKVLGTGGGDREMQSGFRDVVATGAYRANFTIDSSQEWFASVATFKLAAAGGITGTADLTLPAVEIAASGSLIITGSADLTLPAFSVDAAGTVEEVTGISGSADVTLAGFTVSAEGAHPFLGSADVTLSPLGVSASGTALLSITGTGAATLSALTVSASGSMSLDISGTAAVTLEPFEVAASGPRGGLLLHIDWDGSGFEEIPWTENLGIDFKRGGGADLESATTGTLSVTLDNTDDRYTDTNPGSDLVDRVRPNARIWVRVAHEGQLFGLASAYLTDVSALPQDSVAELVGDDLLRRLSEIHVTIAPATGRTYGEYRLAILEAAGIPAAEMDLDVEDGVMVDGSYGSGSALELLEEINEATGSRHFVRTGTTAAAWQQYVSVNRQHKLSQADPDVEINDRLHIERSSFGGWRAAWDTVVNHQAVSVVTPPAFGEEVEEVWAHQRLPLSLAASETREVWASDIGLIGEGALLIDGTGIASSQLTMFADAAKIEITAGGSGATVTALSIEGRPATSGTSSLAIAADGDSQSSYGLAEGAPRSAVGGTLTSAQGLGEHLVWRYHEPRKQPAVTQENQVSRDLALAEAARMLGHDLFEIVGFTVGVLFVTDRRTEIIGETISVRSGQVVTVGWRLQDTPEQPPLTTWARYDETDFDDGSVYAY